MSLFDSSVFIRLPLRTLNTTHFERIETLELDRWD